MKKLFQMSLWLRFVSFAAHGSQNLVRDYDWKQLAQQHELLSGEVVPIEGTWVLKIENTKDTYLFFPLLTITNPPISKKVLTIFGRVKYENVQPKNGNSMIGMLVDFPPGPMRSQGNQFGANFQFFGTSDWTDLILPFYHDDTLAESNSPSKLEISIGLSARGTVYLRPLQLIEYDQKDSPVFATTTSTSWWSGRVSGLIGGIGGSVVGCFGALLGWLAGKGKARNFVLTTIKIFIVLGILLTVAGLVAVVVKQPYAVWYALLLPGVILTLVFSLNLPAIQRRYDDLEIRRMTSLDV